MPKQKVKVLLYPPRITLSSRTDRYKLFIDIQWGEFKRQIELSKEPRAIEERAIEAISVVLLEASETTQPYTLHD